MDSPPRSPTINISESRERRRRANDARRQYVATYSEERVTVELGGGTYASPMQ